MPAGHRASGRVRRLFAHRLAIRDIRHEPKSEQAELSRAARAVLLRGHGPHRPGTPGPGRRREYPGVHRRCRLFRPGHGGVAGRTRLRCGRGRGEPCGLGRLRAQRRPDGQRVLARSGCGRKPLRQGGRPGAGLDGLRGRGHHPRARGPLRHRLRPARRRRVRRTQRKPARRAQDACFQLAVVRPRRAADARRTHHSRTYQHRSLHRRPARQAWRPSAPDEPGTGRSRGAGIARRRDLRALAGHPSAIRRQADGAYRWRPGSRRHGRRVRQCLSRQGRAGAARSRDAGRDPGHGHRAAGRRDRHAA